MKKGKVVFGTALSEVAVIFLGFSASMEVGDGFHLMEEDGRGRDGTNGRRREREGGIFPSEVKK